mmetsp:Transcript_30882/g.47105  ORF Transcript_30882/g.47105 Transcript_30882/m.47105 type:complete len:388 (+) Transcript_30882:150-1313(+)
MKFCINLNRVSNLANQNNPEWAPYWVNYGALKKIVMALPSLVPNNDPPTQLAKQQQQSWDDDEGGDAPNLIYHDDDDKEDDDDSVDNVSSPCIIEKSRGESLNEKEGSRDNKRHHRINSENNSSTVVSRKRRRLNSNDDAAAPTEDKGDVVIVQEMMRRPGEVAFFRLLHSELHKARRFFDGAQRELSIREERIQESIQIVKSNSLSSSSSENNMQEAWSNVFRSLYQLNTNLLLLETYAIMSFCAFSKILKKHDKVTGFDTRMHFMERLVKTSNFADCPKLQEMTRRCESGVNEVLTYLSKCCGSTNTLKDNNLFEDEKLFIHMVEKLNEQARGTAVEEGATQIESRRSSSSSRTGIINMENVSNSKSKLVSYLYSVVDQYGRQIE